MLRSLLLPVTLLTASTLSAQSEPVRLAPTPTFHAAPPRALFIADADAVAAAPIPMRKVAYLGVSTSPVSPQLASHLKLTEGFGLVVDHAEPDSPAAKAGLKTHDILLRLGDQKLINAPQLGTLVRSQKPGDTIELTVIREGKELTLKATLIEKEMPVADVLFPPHDLLLPGGPGDGPRIKWMQRLEPGARLHRAGALGDLRFADDEHQLLITLDKDGRTLIVKDKEGKEIFKGLINTDEEREAVPEAVRPKLDKLEKSSRLNISGIRRGALEAFPGGDIDIELIEPLDADKLKKMIEDQLKGVELEGDHARELKERIEEMKRQVDEMMKRTRLQQDELRARIQRGELPAPAPGVAPGTPGAPGEVQRHEFKSAQSVARMKDDQHDITLKSDDAGRHLTIKDHEGKTLYEGPFNTDEEKAKVPQELRSKIERIEKSVKIHVNEE